MRTRPPNESGESDACAPEDCRPIDERGAWSWKDADRTANPDLGLRYEPGNWGDVLKGTWAVIVARALAERAIRGSREPAPTVRYLDAFAGAPTYPLLGSVAERLRSVRGGEFVRRQERWLAEGRLASTGLLVRDVLRDTGVQPKARIFDLDKKRREAWRSVDDASILDVASGAEALDRVDDDLVLVDPYDLFDDWAALVSRILSAAQGSGERPGATVIVYLYNKSPRGDGRHRNYRRLRDALAKRQGVALLAGRVPSDAILPRAFHEVILLGTPSLVSELSPELSRTTRGMACKLSTSGAFEEENGLDSGS